MEERRAVPMPLLTVGAALAAMWAIELTDVVILGDALDRHGIYPRRLDGLDGVLWAPFLHGGLGHLLANTIPFAILGALVLTEGWRRWAVVTSFVAVAGGLLTWALARPRIHIGVSGVIFGYFGYLLATAYFRRSLRSIVIAAVVTVVYGGGLIIGLLPRPGVSWEGHLFGLAAGVAVALVSVPAAERTTG